MRMTKHQAMEVLLRYRPGTSDERDPDVRAALGLAEADPELAAWLKNHQQVQETLRAAMQDVPVAAGLKEQILSERHVRVNPQTVTRRAILTLAVAGVLGLAAAGFVTWFGQGETETEFSTYRSRMVRTAARGYSMDLETHSAVEVQKYLATRQAHTEWQEAVELETERLLGCAVLQWRGHPATLICYGAQREPDLWLFIVDANAMSKAPGEAKPTFEVVSRMGTLSWSQSGKVYVLMGYRTEEDLRKLARAGG
jgi:hypothetical protein